jgi:hypothetical protein
MRRGFLHYISPPIFRPPNKLLRVPWKNKRSLEDLISMESFSMRAFGTKV